MGGRRPGASSVSRPMLLPICRGTRTRALGESATTRSVTKQRTSLDANGVTMSVPLGREGGTGMATWGVDQQWIQRGISLNHSMALKRMSNDHYICIIIQ